MAIDPKEFTDAAEELRNGRPIEGEVRTRTVVGRAYYAAYLVTRQAIREQTRNPAFDPLHLELADTLKRARDPQVKAIGTALAGMYDYRTSADYFPERNMSGGAMAIVVSESRRVFSLIPKAAGRFPLVRSRR